MAFIDRLKQAVAILGGAGPATFDNPAIWTNAGPGHAPITTAEGALGVCAVYACVRVVAQAVGGLPLKVYKRAEDGSKAPAQPEIAALLSNMSDSQPDVNFWETLITYAMLEGNGFAINQQSNGQDWMIVSPHSIEITRSPGATVYKLILPGGVKQPLKRENLIHLMGIGLDGIKGMSVIGTLRKQLEAGAIQQDVANNYYANATTASGKLMFPAAFNREKIDEALGLFEQKHAGAGNSGKTMALSHGVQYERFPPVISAEDMQFVEARKFQVVDICRIFGVPPHMVAELDKTTIGNIEQQSMDFLTHTLRPWLVRLEQALNRNILSILAGPDYFCEFKVEGLLRADLKSRYSSYAVALTNGFLSINEARRLENLDPIANGDNHYRPLNLSPIGSQDGAI